MSIPTSLFIKTVVTGIKRVSYVVNYSDTLVTAADVLVVACQLIMMIDLLVERKDCSCSCWCLDDFLLE